MHLEIFSRHLNFFNFGDGAFYYASYIPPQRRLHDGLKTVVGNDFCRSGGAIVEYGES